MSSRPLAAAASLTARAESRAAPRSTRLPFIDGLRGLAILLVLAYHCWVHTIAAAIYARVGRWRLDLTAPLHYGYVGVHLFLLLSGFCLTYPLARRGAAGLRVELGRFFQRRAWRILPPYYVALAAFALMRAVMHTRGQSEAVTPGNLLAHLLMIHNLFPQWMGAINGSFWSLALEWQLYLVFPLLIWGVRRFGLLPALAAVLAMTLSYRTWVYVTRDLGGLESGYFYCYSLPGRLFEFALGMAAALLLARLGSAALAAASRRYLAGAGVLGALAVTVAARWSPYAPVTDVLWGGAFFCLLLYAGGRAARGGGWLEWRPLEKLGVCSYSVYLIHEPLIRMSYSLLRPRLHSPVITLLSYELGALPLLIGLGWAYFCVIESRFLQAGKTRARRTTNPPPVLPAEQEGRTTELRYPPADRVTERELVRH